MFCENCGSKLPDGSKFCMNCGAKTASDGLAIEKAAQEAAVAADTTAAAEMSAVDQVLPEARKSSSDQAGVPIIDKQPAQQPEAAQQPAAAYTQPPPQAAPRYAQPAQPSVAAPVPEKTEPLGVLKYLGIMIVTCIPILGFIMILVWSFSSSFNRNTRNFARALLILWIIGVILSIVVVVLYWSILSSIFNNFEMLPTAMG